MGKASTSFREQVLFFYILQFYPDALNRYKYKSIGELDIYIPSEKAAIEYDGRYWHRNKLSLDNKKNDKARLSGIRLIRIREYGLESTDGAFGEFFLPRTDNDYDIEYLEICFREIGKLLMNKSLETYSLGIDVYKKNLPHIYSKLYDTKVEPNLSNMCGIELWDKSFNGDLSPACIPKYEWAYALLQCKNGQSIVLPRYRRDFHDECKEIRKEGCKNCISHLICPLMKWCSVDRIGIAECDIVEKQVYNMIEQGICYAKCEHSAILSNWLWIRSNLGINLVKVILSMDRLDPKRKEYYKFFGFRTNNDSDGIISMNIFVKNEEERKLLEKLAKELEYTSIDVMISPQIINN